MNYTTNYHLNQWAKSDQVRMEDFNADNAKIDAAIKAEADARAAGDAALQAVLNAKGNCQIATGTYTGSGTCGVNAPNTLTFPFQPVLVVIAANSNGSPAVLVPGVEENIYLTGMVARWKLTWTGNSVSWYVSQVNWASGSSGPLEAYYQMNVANMLYRYIVFGKKG